MAASLSVQEYIQHFLLNRDRELARVTKKRIKSQTDLKPRSPATRRLSDAHLPSPNKFFAPNHQNYGLMLAHVYQIIKGNERLIYSKRIVGHKNKDVYGIFVQDMIGNKAMKASNLSDGKMSRGSSISDVSSISYSDNEEGELQPNTSVVIYLTASRSPSNIGSAELMGLLEHCKRNSIRIATHLRFAHAFTWDNKYNREGLENLSSRGIKLSSLSLPQVLQSIFDDIKENVESLHELQTCRGTILVNEAFVERAMSAFRHSVIVRSDFYHQDQTEQLNEITGKPGELPQYKQFGDSKVPAVFSLETYREYILLQNIDVEWVKLKIGISKVKKGVTKEEAAYQNVVSSLEKSSSKSQKNSNNQKNLNVEEIWEKVGNRVTMVDLSEFDQIILTVNAILSEYSGHVGWVEEITQLHNSLRDKAEESELYKVSVETTIRYAQSIEGPVQTLSNGVLNNGAKTNGLSNGYTEITTLGFPKGMRVECLSIQDILFEMLEDVEDNIRFLASLDYGRGANLAVDKDGLARAMGFLNKSINIRTADGTFSMNDDFIDDYADEMNGL